jgi:hypothetical protein
MGGKNTRNKCDTQHNIMLSVFKLSVAVKLNMLSVNMLNVIMPNVIMPNVIMPNVIMLSVIAAIY